MIHVWYLQMISQVSSTYTICFFNNWMKHKQTMPWRSNFEFLCKSLHTHTQSHTYREAKKKLLRLFYTPSIKKSLTCLNTRIQYIERLRMRKPGILVTFKGKKWRVISLWTIIMPFTRDRSTSHCTYLLNYLTHRGDGLAQWLECWTGDPKAEGLNP